MAVLPTHKHSLTYLEHCRIVMADERLAYLRAEGAVERSFSLPYANSNVLLLGPGTSITQQAARLLAEEGIALAFTAGGGTPLFMTSISEYRPTEHQQRWCTWWYTESARLAVAKHWQRARVDWVQRHAGDDVRQHGLDELASNYLLAIEAACSNSELLLAEARYAKTLYGLYARTYNISFSRQPRGGDRLNDFIDAGNYMAYGMAACALWVLGVSFAFGVNHGMTRRGALVFDLADVVKDAVVLPQAFIAHAANETPSEHRVRTLIALENSRVLLRMLETVVEANVIGQQACSPSASTSS